MRIRWCEHCKGIMVEVYSGLNGWEWHCVKCLSKIPLGKEEVPSVSQELASKSYTGFSLYREKKFDEAKKCFHGLVDCEKDAWLYLWNEILCLCGVTYCSDELAPVIWKKPTKQNTVKTTEEFMKLTKHAASYDSAVSAYFNDQAEIIGNIQNQIILLSTKKPCDVFVSYSSHSEDSRNFAKCLKDCFVKVSKENRNYQAEVFFAEESLNGQNVNMFESLIFHALYTAKELVLVIGKSVSLGNKTYPAISEWMRNEYERFIYFHGIEKVRICLVDDATINDLPTNMRNIQMQQLYGSAVEDKAVSAAQSMALAFHYDSGSENLDIPPVPQQEDSKKQDNYRKAVVLLKQSEKCRSLQEKARLIKDAKDVFDSLGDYQQAAQQSTACAEKINKIETELAETYSNACILEGECRFDDAKQLFASLEGYLESKEKASVCQQKIDLYTQARNQLKQAKGTEEYTKIAESFEQLGQYKDSEKLYQQCINNAKLLNAKTEMDLKSGRFQQAYGLAYNSGNSTENLKIAIEIFNELGEYNNSNLHADYCRRRINGIEEQARQEREKEVEKIHTQELADNYKFARREMNSAKSEEDYLRVSGLFKALGQYRNAEKLAQECYDYAVRHENQAKLQQYEKCKLEFKRVRAMTDTQEKITELNKLAKAFEAFDGFAGSKEYSDSCAKEIERIYANTNKQSDIDGYYKRGMEIIHKLETDKLTNDTKLYYATTAVKLFEKTGTYKDSEAQLSKCKKLIKQLGKAPGTDAKENLNRIQKQPAPDPDTNGKLTRTQNQPVPDLDTNGTLTRIQKRPPVRVFALGFLLTVGSVLGMEALSPLVDGSLGTESILLEILIILGMIFVLPIITCGLVYKKDKYRLWRYCMLYLWAGIGITCLIDETTFYFYQDLNHYADALLFVYSVGLFVYWLFAKIYKRNK